MRFWHEQPKSLAGTQEERLESDLECSRPSEFKKNRGQPGGFLGILSTHRPKPCKGVRKGKLGACGAGTIWRDSLIDACKGWG